MFKSVMIGALIATISATGSILGGQNTGGDKGRRTKTAAAPGLNPSLSRLGGIITGVIIVGIGDIRTL